LETTVASSSAGAYPGSLRGGVIDACRTLHEVSELPSKYGRLENLDAVGDPEQQAARAQEIVERARYGRGALVRLEVAPAELLDDDARRPGMDAEADNKLGAGGGGSRR
jgi:hypothetical protein